VREKAEKNVRKLKRFYFYITRGKKRDSCAFIENLQAKREEKK
jgi:hypothetical protein